MLNNVSVQKHNNTNPTQKQIEEFFAKTLDQILKNKKFLEEIKSILEKSKTKVSIDFHDKKIEDLYKQSIISLDFLKSPEFVEQDALVFDHIGSKILHFLRLKKNFYRSNKLF